MDENVGFFEVEQQDDVAVVITCADMSELDYESIDKDATELLQRIDAGQISKVVVDFHRTDYFGSTAIGFFVKLWKRLKQEGGRIAFCGLSHHQRDVIAATKLDTVWEILDSKDAAIESVRKQ